MFTTVNKVFVRFTNSFYLRFTQRLNEQGTYIRTPIVSHGLKMCLPRYDFHFNYW